MKTIASNFLLKKKLLKKLIELLKTTREMAQISWPSKAEQGIGKFCDKKDRGLANAKILQDRRKTNNNINYLC